MVVRLVLVLVDRFLTLVRYSYVESPTQIEIVIFCFILLLSCRSILLQKLFGSGCPQQLVAALSLQATIAIKLIPSTTARTGLVLTVGHPSAGGAKKQTTPQEIRSGEPRRSQTYSHAGSGACTGRSVMVSGSGVVEWLVPETNRQRWQAQVWADFAQYCTSKENEWVRTLVETSETDDVGLLQGGAAAGPDIYRVAIHVPPVVKNGTSSSRSNHVSQQMLRRFCQDPSTPAEYAKVATFEGLQAYILTMCRQKSKQASVQSMSSSCLENFMLIVSFAGGCPGQVWHIDRMDDNHAVFLYLTDPCPTTRYSVPNEHDDDGGDDHDPGVDSVETLLECWEHYYTSTDPTITPRQVPDALRQVMSNHADTPLTVPRRRRGKQIESALQRQRPMMQSSWTTLNDQLRVFGRLYQQPVRSTLYLPTVEPGTIGIASGNAIHAGPPTTAPRMVVFGIGVPSEDTSTTTRTSADNNDKDRNRDDDNNYDDDNQNDGEVQYSAILLHVDLCIIVFAMLEENETDVGEESVQSAKAFLLHVLDRLDRENRAEKCDADLQYYYRQVLGGNDEQTKLCDWLIRRRQRLPTTSGGQVDDGGSWTRQDVESASAVFRSTGNHGGARPSATSRHRQRQEQKATRKKRGKVPSD